MKDLAAQLHRAALTCTSSCGRPDKAAAARLVSEGAGDAYSQALESGELRGDRTFQHKFVQCLLSAARRRVKEALQQCRTEFGDDDWLICVRTYGRAGNPVHTEPGTHW